MKLTQPQIKLINRYARLDAQRKIAVAEVAKINKEINHSENGDPTLREAVANLLRTFGTSQATTERQVEKRALGTNQASLVYTLLAIKEYHVPAKQVTQISAILK
jgi:hypothetical protein